MLEFVRGMVCYCKAKKSILIVFMENRYLYGNRESMDGLGRPSSFNGGPWWTRVIDHDSHVAVRTPKAY